MTPFVKPAAMFFCLTIILFGVSRELMNETSIVHVDRMESSRIDWANSENKFLPIIFKSTNFQLIHRSVLLHHVEKLEYRMQGLLLWNLLLYRTEVSNFLTQNCLCLHSTHQLNQLIGCLCLSLRMEADVSIFLCFRNSKMRCLLLWSQIRNYAFNWFRFQNMWSDIRKCIFIDCLSIQQN